jgi:hypothetical protein
METRFGYRPDLYIPLLDPELYLRQCGLEESLLHLIKRLPNQRLRLLSGYALEGPARDSEKRSRGYTPWTRGANAPTLPIANALLWRGRRPSLVSPAAYVSGTVYEDVGPHFSEKELSDLTLAVAAINAWNRLSIAARTLPGTYQPTQP